MIRAILPLLFVLAFVIFTSVNAQEAIEEIADSSNTMNRPSPARDADSLKPAPVSTALSEAQALKTPFVTPVTRFGFGISFGERVYYPPEINDFSKDIWSEMTGGYGTTAEVGSTDVYMAYALRVHFFFSPVPYLDITPYEDVLWSPKFLSASYLSENINFLCYTGGVNAVRIFAPYKRVSFKAGAGLSYGSANLYASGDLGDVTLSGSVFGINLLAGINITVSNLIVNIDFTVPVQTARFTSQSGVLQGPDYYYGTMPLYRYPKSETLIGLEIGEGVTILW